MPSEAIPIKSWFSVILKLLISGIAIITFGFPPYYFSFASISPKVLDTLNQPGITLCGPIIYVDVSVTPSIIVGICVFV